MITSVLEARQISKTYDSPAGPLTVLADVTFRLQPGESAAITGPSGSGKSSLLYVLGGLEAPTSGSMGYGLPAAIAASIAHPGRMVVCLAGDGCIQMTVNELSTAAQYGATPIVIVANNGRYGTIRMHQERHYPGRVSGTDLFNPDFAALARAYGGHGERVQRDADFAPAFERARLSGRLAVIELALDPEALTPGATLTQTRDAALRAQA